MMERKIVELIETIENLAPEAWEVLVYQQLIEGWSLVAIAVAIAIFGMWATSETQDEGKPIIIMIWLTFAVLFGVLAMHNLINPEFQAIKELLPR